jgi:hypothetical protein
MGKRLDLSFNFFTSPKALPRLILKGLSLIRPL